jgi:hypothetical protein
VQNAVVSRVLHIKLSILLAMRERDLTHGRASRRKITSQGHRCPGEKKEKKKKQRSAVKQQQQK